eukprot:5699546-Amphidinium_carterae.1
MAEQLQNELSLILSTTGSRAHASWSIFVVEGLTGSARCTWEVVATRTLTHCLNTNGDRLLRWNYACDISMIVPAGQFAAWSLAVLVANTSLSSYVAAGGLDTSVPNIALLHALAGWSTARSQSSTGHVARRERKMLAAIPVLVLPLLTWFCSSLKARDRAWNKEKKSLATLILFFAGRPVDVWPMFKRACLQHSFST